MAHPQPDDLPERVRAQLGSAAQGLPDPLDASNPNHVDAAAKALIERFFGSNDPTAFELLVELSLPILNGAVEDVAREEGVAAGAQTLLTPLFTGIFVALRPPPGLLDAPFLSWVVGNTRESARARVATLAARRIPLAETNGAAPAATEPLAGPDTPQGQVEPKSSTVLGRLSEAACAGPVPDLTPLGLTLGGIVDVVYHRLRLDDRRILRCVEVAKMSDATAAAFLRIPEAEPPERAARARVELQAAARSVLDALSASLTCALHGADLAAVSAEQLAGHLVDCTTCTEQVGLMHALGDVPGWLKSVETNPDGASRVEQVLAVANAQGTEELARLLYEMVRAALNSLEGWSQQNWLVTPPPPLTSLTPTAETHGARVHADGTASPPGASDPLDAAERCCLLLESTAPGSVRALFARGLVSIEREQNDVALSCFESVSHHSQASAHAVAFSRLNTMRVLLRLQEYERVTSLANLMVREDQLVDHALMHHAWIAAWRHDKDGFLDAAHRFAGALRSLRSEQQAWWERHLPQHAEWIAQQLEMSSASVLSALGINSRGGS